MSDAPEPDPAAKGSPKLPRGFFGKLWHEWVRPIGTVLLVVIVVRSSLIDWNDVPSGSMRPTILEGDRIVVNKLAYGLNTPFNGPRVDIPLTGISFDNPLDFGPRWLYSAPERGDIVTFWNPTPKVLNPDDIDADTGAPRINPSSGIRMVKRVVGLPGDTLRVVDGRLEITDAAGNAVPVDYGPLPSELGADLYTAEPTQARRVDGAGRAVAGATRMHPVRFLEERLGGADEASSSGLRHAIQFIERDRAWIPAGHQHRDLATVTLADPPGRADDEFFVIGDNRDNSLDSRYYAGLGVAVTGKHITGKAKFIAVSFDGSWLKPAFSRWFSGFDK